MEVRLCGPWEIKVDDHIDGLNIDTSSQEVRTDQVSSHACSKVVKDSVSMGLKHLGVRVETRVSAIRDFLG